jgi:hypothetical protein
MGKLLLIFFLLLFLICLINIPFGQTFNEVKTKASQGNAQAQRLLGLMYYKGKGFKQDLAQAKFWLEKASAQGDTQAQKLLEAIIGFIPLEPESL